MARLCLPEHGADRVSSDAVIRPHRGVWKRFCARRRSVVIMCGHSFVAALAVLLWTLQTSPSAAHLWQEAAADLEPGQIEGMVSALETAAQAAAEDGWHPREEIAENSTSLAYALLRWAGRLDDIPPEGERMLVTYDALRLDVIDETGTFTPHANIFHWFETLRTTDAPGMAPFRARLDAWRALLLEAE